MKPIVLLAGFWSLAFSAFCQNFNITYRITPWQGNKAAVACITFDDHCPGQFAFALPALNERNLKATFFVVPNGNPCGPIDWVSVDSAFARGHEIASHSSTHLNLANADSATIEAELQGGYTALRQRYYPEGWKMTIAYPFGRGGGSSAQDKRIRRLASKYYYGGRSAGIGPSGFTGYSDFTNPFYTDFYLQWGTYVMGPDGSPTGAQLSTILDNTMQAGGIFTGLYHGIETTGYNTIPASLFREHLDSLKAREGRMWVTTFGQAIQYHAQRRALPVLENLVWNATEGRGTFVLRDTLTGPWFREPLTFRLPRLQNGIPLDSFFLKAKNVRIEADTVQFDLAPGDTMGIQLLITGAKSRMGVGGDGLVFPNPATDRLELFPFSGQAEVWIYSAEGKILQNRKLNSGESLPLSFLSRGWYGIRLVSQGQVRQGRFWKE